MGEDEGSLYRPVGLAADENTPNFIPAPTIHVSERIGSVQPPIRTKPRTTRSARRAGQFYLTLIPFREHFPEPNKIIRLLNKRGFRSDGEGSSCAGSCDSARVKPGVTNGHVRWRKGSVTHA